MKKVKELQQTIKAKEKELAELYKEYNERFEKLKIERLWNVEDIVRYYYRSKDYQLTNLHKLEIIVNYCNEFDEVQKYTDGSIVRYYPIYNPVTNEITCIKSSHYFLSPSFNSGDTLSNLINCNLDFFKGLLIPQDNKRK